MGQYSHSRYKNKTSEDLYLSIFVGQCSGNCQAICVKIAVHGKILYHMVDVLNKIKRITILCFQDIPITVKKQTGRVEMREQ